MAPYRESISDQVCDCSRSAAAMPLAMAVAGDSVVVQHIRGGKKMRARLFDLGLNINARIRVLKNDPRGPLILAVKEDGRFALGKGMAQHILVCNGVD